MIAAALLSATAIAATPAAAVSFDILHAFSGGRDGQSPFGGLLADSAGNLYGTTTDGGGNTGAGTLFRLGTDGTDFTVLHTFTTFYTDPRSYGGSNPRGGLIADSIGNLYGTTYQGGTQNGGTVFKLDTSGAHSVLHSFEQNEAGFSFSEGRYPFASLTADATGNLYGTTYAGGDRDYGTIFRLGADGDDFTVLHSFTGGAGGAFAYGNLLADGKGNFYGTTLGATQGNHQGTLFKLDADGNFTTLYSHGLGNGSYAGLIADAAGNLYGTTDQGGTHHNGTIFKFDTNGVYSVLHNFAGSGSGANPRGNLLLDAEGNLYGTTHDASPYDSFSNGTVFRLGVDGTYAVLHSGGTPFAGLIADAEGNLYGTTTGQLGDDWSSAGAIFKLSDVGFVLPSTPGEPGEPGNPGAVPEPATWAMMIAGFGLVGSVARRRRETLRSAC
ncbi:PEPxxWA-CTERM sorting domain-containing protein [Sandaracinobacter sp. RS1-74]|nr:choice-of-anchor tandem repeat GloVer-containing protein [Sandaracinobacteroides sayramensis]MCG2841052.1 PEPxxWA-CTERM sorting domain-containing protein [Sandaracinobacteroides sayramensis]